VTSPHRGKGCGVRAAIRPWWRELEERATSLGNKLRIGRSAVNLSVRRGEKIVEDKGVERLPKE